MQSNIEVLQAASPAQRAQAKDQFVGQLRSDLDALVTLVASKSKDLESKKRIDPEDAVYLAVEILQFARYRPAADLCVRLLDTRSLAFPAVSDEMEAHFPYFPFAVTAAAIGTPALPALTAVFLHADPATTRFHLCCLVLKEILGDELAVQHLANSTAHDPALRDGQKVEQATKFIRTETNAWEASFCSDYSPL